jgi:hypothetical protein
VEGLTALTAVSLGEHLTRGGNITELTRHGGLLVNRDILVRSAMRIRILRIAIDLLELGMRTSHPCLMNK